MNKGKGNVYFKIGNKIGPISAFTLLSMAAICRDSLIVYIRIIISMIPGIGAYLVPYTYPIIFTFLTLCSISYARMRKIRTIDILFIVVVYMWIYISYLAHPENQQYIEEQWGYILSAIPYFFLGLCFEFDIDTRDFISKCCCVAIYIRLIYSVGLQIIGRTFLDDQMDYAYLLLICVLIAINYAFEVRNLFSRGASVLGFIYLISMGTRGPIVIVAAFLLLCFLVKDSQKSVVKILSVIILGFLLILMLSPAGELLIGLITYVLENIGLSTRILDYLLLGTFISDTTSRDYITTYLLGLLEKNSYIGYGFYAEWKYGFYSAHNIYVELAFHVGMVLAVILISLYVLLYVRALAKNKQNVIKDWLLLFGCYVFVQGIFGGRYISPYSFFLLGLCINSLRVSKKEYRRKDIAYVQKR